VQRSIAGRLRSASKPPPVITPPLGVPAGYVTLEDFNKTINKYGKYSGVKGTGVDETGIYVKAYDGTKVLLWWASPKAQIDNFTYQGSSKDDISLCSGTRGYPTGYTWHHTGYPANDMISGTMQLVPTVEHSALKHIGGCFFAYGTYEG